MIEIVMTIIWAVSLGVLLLCAVIGLFGGLRRGAYHAGVKLGAHILSVFLALVITLCLRGVVVGFVTQILLNQFDQLPQDADMVKLVAHIPTSVLLLAVFWLIFVIVRPIMRIPQKILCKKLPANYADAMEKHKEYLQRKAERKSTSALPAHSKIAEEQENSSAENSALEALSELKEQEKDSDLHISASEEQTMEEPAVQPLAEATAEQPVSVQTPREINPMLGKVLWYGCSVLCGILSSVLMLGVMIMPISSTMVRVGNAVTKVTDTLEEDPFLNENRSNENFGIVSDSVRKTMLSPLFTVTDFFYGKTVYEPLTSFNTAYGRINLSKELDIGTQMICKLIPVVSPMLVGGAEKELGDEDARILEEVTKQASESKFLMTAGSLGIRLFADTVADGKTESEAMGALKQELSSIMEDMTPDALAEDVRSATDLVVVMADSPILQNLLDDKKDNDQPKFADLADREMMREAFDVVYENDHAQALLVPMLNWVTEQMFMGMDVEPVYSDADLSDLSRKEMAAEADRLCDAVQGLSAFADSVSQGQEVTDYRLTEAGKALDALKESVIFGNQYEPMVRSVSAMETKGENGTNTNLVSSLSDALVNGSSAENLMNAAQSVVTLGDELEKGEKKGRENEKLMSSMETLLNHTEEENAVALKGIAGDTFTGNGSTAEKNKLIGYFTESVVEVSKIENVDIATEADAIQAMYDISHSETGKVFLQISEKEMVNLFLESHVAISVLGQANNDGEDFGVWDKLTLIERDNILKAIQEADSKYDANKGVVATFFKLAWPQ